jgi:hypothetical protein
MSKTLAGFLVAATAVIGLSTAPARADVLYIDSDGTMHNFSSDVMLDRTIVSPAVVEPTTTQIITQPAVIDTMPVMTTPVVTTPTVIERRRNHLLDVGIPGLFGVHLF